MDETLYIVKPCQVISVDDSTDGARIKARVLKEDQYRTNDEIPYAFPLLPKMLHIKPKVGEAVLVICADAKSGNSDRYYIGPIISQPQFMAEDRFEYGALTLLNGSVNAPSTAPSTNPNTEGAFPKNNDVAICGRENSDIILSDSDIRIRCGAHLTDQTDKTNIVFNKKNPAYAKLKYHRTSLDNGNSSSATIVADEINLLSPQSKQQFNLTDKDEQISDNEMNKIIESAHVLPYGDILVDFLKKFVKAFQTHTHPYSGLPPCQDSTYTTVSEYDMNTILSENVRIN